MDVVQLNFAYNTEKSQFKLSKFLGSYQARAESPTGAQRRGDWSRARGKRPSGTESIRL